MGHIRLGLLPHTRQWREVAALIADGGGDAAAVARSIAQAAEHRLTQVEGDAGISYLYWALTRLTWHARGDDFREGLAREGISFGADANGIRLLSQLGQSVADEARRRGENSAVTELAVRAFRETLNKAVVSRSETLFGTTQETVQGAFRDVSTPKAFGKLAREFFTGVYGGILQFVASKETSQHVGPGMRFENSDAAASFERELRIYAHESSRIVEDFAGEWYSKHNWQRDLDQAQSQRFVAYAMTKLRAELARERQRP